MKRFIINLIVNAVALYVAIALLNGRGITPQSDNWLALLWLALIFGLVNAILKPILTVLGCPVIVLTLGFGLLLINTLLFWLAGAIGTNFGVGFTVDGFMPALLGSIIVSIVSWALSLFFGDKDRSSSHR